MLIRVSAAVGILASIAVILTFIFTYGRSPSGTHPAAESTTPASTAPSTPTGTPTPVVSASRPASRAASANGTELNSYPVNLPQTDSVPLGPTRPTLSQLIEWSGGDIFYDGMTIMPGPGDQMLDLANDQTPTYQACMNSVPENRAPATAGTTFCVVEPGLMVGVTVDSVDTTQPYDYYLALSVIVWKDS